MDFSSVIFRRKFSMNLYKNQKIAMGKMTFSKDFVQDRRGDLYPLLEKSGSALEEIVDGHYVVQGFAKRWFCQFFPYLTCEVTAKGNAGFCFTLGEETAQILKQDQKLFFTCGGQQSEFPVETEERWTMMVTCRPAAFDVYFKNQEDVRFCCSFKAEEFRNSTEYARFSKGYAALCASDCEIHAVSAYLDCGISQADLRPICYENGDVLMENGTIYLTASIRLEEQMFQGIFSWLPGTAELRLTGALFYDAGDGKWCGDVAASVLYHRKEQQFYLWVCSFNRGHILGHAVFDGDLRFGVNVADITLMEKAADHEDITVFRGKRGDEDPAFIYDEETQKWYMAICRKDPVIKEYRYVFFESDHPFEGYTYIGKGLDGAETGGSFVQLKGELHFICGNDFHATSDYRIYSKDGMQNARFDYPDGGFRGWGSLMPVKLGSRTRYFWITFDRHNGSAFNWSYGNLYCFEADIT